MGNECGSGIYLSPEELTSDAAERIAGIDFLHITDTNSHDVDCYMIYANTAAVFTEIFVDGVNVVTAKGLSGKTIQPGIPMPFGKSHATSIKLASGTVFAYTT